jgi:hypothetical protein
MIKPNITGVKDPAVLGWYRQFAALYIATPHSRRCFPIPHSARFNWKACSPEASTKSTWAHRCRSSPDPFYRGEKSNRARAPPVKLLNSEWLRKLPWRSCEDAFNCSSFEYNPFRRAIQCTRAEGRRAIHERIFSPRRILPKRPHSWLSPQWLPSSIAFRTDAHQRQTGLLVNCSPMKNRSLRRLPRAAAGGGRRERSCHFSAAEGDLTSIVGRLIDACQATVFPARIRF